LIDKEPYRISRAEIDRVTQSALERRAFQVRVRIAQDHEWRLAVRVLFRQKSRKNTAELEIDIQRPENELRLEPLERRVGLVRDEDIHAEALDPSIRASAEPQRVSLLRDELPVQFGLDPFGHFHGEGSAFIRDSLVGALLRPSLAR
jgi:hypothetical protein